MKHRKIIDGEYLAASVNLIILRQELTDIREMMKDRWDEIEKESPNIPEFQRPITETFDYTLSQFLQKVKKEGRFHELVKEAYNHRLYKAQLESLFT